MIAKGAKRRSSSVALVMLAALLVGGIALPIIVSFSSDQISVSTSRLAAASRDFVMVYEPISLGSTGAVRLDKGIVSSVDSAGQSTGPRLSPEQIVSGTSRFTIEDGQISVRVGDGVAKADGASPILEALSALQFEQLVLRRTALTIMLPDGRTETISGADGAATLKRKSLLTLKGRGEWRGQTVNFEATAGVTTDQRGTVPLKFVLKNSLVDVSFDGRATVNGPVQLHGAVELAAPNVRQFARWFGAAWPMGNGLRNLSGRGQLDWSGPTLAFNRANVMMDGNDASGTLNIRLAGEKPSIGGTLALSTLDLSTYFAAQASSPQNMLKSAWNVLLGSDMSMPLAQHFDADIRISTDKIRLGTRQFGRSAAAVTVAKGRMLADFGTFEFDGGRGSGQIIADMSAGTPKVSVRGKLEDLDGARVATSLFGHPVVSGRTIVTTDATATGHTGEELLATATGRITVSIPAGGAIGVDVRSMNALSKRRAIDGWNAAGRGQTTFSQLDANFAVRAGALVAEDVKALTGDVATTLHGVIEIPNARLNVTIEQQPQSDIAKATTKKDAVLALQIFGGWSAPTIRNDSAKYRAQPYNMPDVITVPPEANKSPSKL